jgi:ATP-binding cassette subfamily B protein
MTRHTDTAPENIPLKRHAQLVLHMLRVSWHIRWNALVIYFAGAALEIGGSLVAIYATARLGALVAAFIAHGQTDYIWLWLWVDVAASAAISLGFWAMGYARRLLYFAFTRWSTTTMLATLCRIDLADYYDETMRNQINKVSGGYSWQLSNLSGTILELLYGMLRFAALTVVVAQITWWLVPILALFLVPTLLAEGRMAKLQWFVWDAKGDQRHVFWGLDYILRQAKGQMELRSSQASKYVLNKIDDMNGDFYTEQEGKYRRANRLLVPTKLFEVAGTALGSIVLLRQLLSRTILLDRYFFLSGALLRSSGALNAIFGTLSHLQEPLLFADSFFRLTDTQPKIVDQPNAVAIERSQVPDIVFDHVSFGYPGQETLVFDDLSLHIRAGEHVALVGENGAGKSTLIKLLLRFYEPTSGRILVNGQDLNDVAIESWYSQLATLFQDFNHYPLPIDENIQIGRSDQPPSEKLLTEAATFSGVNDFVSNYKHGWDTVLDSSFKKGVEPSGGQWQRVALARAFYRQANVIILDEPTSAIDARAEYHIFNNIFEHYQDKTALIVSHRFSTVRRANRIVVLDQGKIIEQGTHEQLMKHHGLYHDIFEKQAQGYK